MTNRDRIWLWLADNGNIRKWQGEPFTEGREYVRADSLQEPAFDGDVAKLVEELRAEDFRHEMQHLRSSAEIDRLFQQSADTIERLSARIAQAEAALEPCTTCAGTGFMDKGGARIAMQRTPCPDCATPPDQSQEIERLRARVAELEARNTRIRSEWDNCDEMLQAYRSAESRLASQERAPVVGELVIEAINDVLIDAEVEYPVGYHKGMHTITFDEDQMRAALEAALASSKERQP